MFLSDLPPYVPPSQVQVDLTRMSAAERRALVLTAERLQDPWLGYVASPVLEAFHRSCALNRYLRAASQAGKTMGCAREAWMYATQTHPFRVTPRKSGLGLIAVGSKEGTASIGVTTALWNTRPPHLIDWDLTHWTGPTHWPAGGLIHLTNGCVIRILTSRGGSTGAASVQADWIWIDEPPKMDKFSELMARVTSTGGAVWLSFTPYDSEQDLTWLKLYLEGEPDRGRPPESPGWERFIMELNTINCPWMSLGSVAQIWSQTPGWIADQRLRGAWDTPPPNAYFRLDPGVHDKSVPLDIEGLQVGAWFYVASGDHGELAGHEHFVFFRVRKVRDAARRLRVQVQILTEYASVTRSNVADDARGIQAALGRLATQEGDPSLAVPAAWKWSADINSAGKLAAGVSVNEALSVALGMRADKIERPDKSAGSVERGLVTLKTALDSFPCDFRLASGSTGLEGVGAPKTWIAMARHKGKDDATKHAMDAIRYGVCPYLDLSSHEVDLLPEPLKPRAFAAPLIG
jgi:phage terminase large subunit-like protein